MKLKRLLLGMIAIMMAVSFTSCDSDDFLDPALYGQWTLQSDLPSVIDRYTFYDNGTGVYNGVNELGQWDTFKIDWYVKDNNRLYVYFVDAKDTWWFYYRFENDRGYQYLVLNNRDNGQDYWYYPSPY